MIREVDPQGRVNPVVFKSLIAQESSFRPEAEITDQQGKRHLGLAQLGEREAKDVNMSLEDMADPVKAIRGGYETLLKKKDAIDRYLDSNYKPGQYSERERTELALAAYRWGEGNIRAALRGAKKRGVAVPRIGDLDKNMRDYVGSILERAGY